MTIWGYALGMCTIVCVVITVHMIIAWRRKVLKAREASRREMIEQSKKMLKQINLQIDPEQRLTCENCETFCPVFAAWRELHDE